MTDAVSDYPEPDAPGPSELDALSSTVRAVQHLDKAAQARVLRAVAAFLDLESLATSDSGRRQASVPEQAYSSSGRFSEDRTPSPKEFLLEKKATTDVERITCLAYYLTHYRETPHFKTLDLSKLNTEAAQLKFSNAAFASDNAVRAGFLVPAGKGAKQISALGELYVQALPDRVAAKEAVAHMKPRRKNKKRGRASASASDGDTSDE